MPGKVIQFHPEVLAALDQLGDDRAATMQELADEAFDDLLRKHGRPIGLKAALRESNDEPATRTLRRVTDRVASARRSPRKRTRTKDRAKG